jgi:hypothetical protein
MTTLHAGGKFDGKSYAVSGGLHGVGVSVVNALSMMLEVEVRRDGYVWTQAYERGDPMGPLVRGAASDETGTTITFWPDDAIFETTEWSFETLSRRMQEMAFLNKDLAISIVDERQAETRSARYQYAGGIADFVRYINASKDAIHGSVIDFEEEAEGIAVEIAMQWSSAYTESVHTFANTINTAEGGTHEEGFRAALTSIVNRYARDQKLLREKDDNLTGWATPRPSRSYRRPATTTCGTGLTGTRARPRRSSTRPARRLGRGSPHARRVTSPAASRCWTPRPCPASWPTASPPIRPSPRSTWWRATRLAARPRAAGIRSSRPSCRSAARSSTWRSRGSTGS